MTDLTGAMRDAAERMSAETVAPPFARIEHRHRVRRARRVALAGAAAAVVGGIAVAAPGLPRATDTTPTAPTPSPSPSASLTPYFHLYSDERGKAAVRGCLDAAGHTLPSTSGLPVVNGPIEPLFVPGFAEAYDRCLVASGYGAFAVRTVPELIADMALNTACETTMAGAMPFFQGGTGTERWQFKAGFDRGLICLLVTYDSKEWSAFANEERESPPPREDRFRWHGTKGELLLYGWRDPRATRVEVEIDGKTYEQVLTGPVGGPAKFYAMTVPHPRDEGFELKVRAYDSDGNRVGRDNRIIAPRA